VPLKESPPQFPAGVEFERLNRGSSSTFLISGKLWIHIKVEAIEVHSSSIRSTHLGSFFTRLGRFAGKKSYRLAKYLKN